MLDESAVQRYKDTYTHSVHCARARCVHGKQACCVHGVLARCMRGERARCVSGTACVASGPAACVAKRPWRTGRYVRRDSKRAFCERGVLARCVHGVEGLLRAWCAGPLRAWRAGPLRAWRSVRGERAAVCVATRIGPPARVARWPAACMAWRATSS